MAQVTSLLFSAILINRVEFLHQQQNSADMTGQNSIIWCG